MEIGYQNYEVKIPVTYIIAGPDAQSNSEFKLLLDSYKILNFRGSFTTFDMARNSICKEPPDVAFVTMDKAELNAYELHHEIRAFNLFSKVIFISSHKEDAVDAFEYGVDGFILKPFDEDKVGHMLMLCIDKE